MEIKGGEGKPTNSGLPLPPERPGAAPGQGMFVIKLQLHLGSPDNERPRGD